jgi:hypothetical protein
MNGERGLVDRTAALHNLAVVVDEQQIRHAYVPEVHAERVDPEVVGQLWIAGRDVAGHALVEPETAEEPEPGRQSLFAMAAFVFDVFEGWRLETGLIEE